MIYNNFYACFPSNDGTSSFDLLNCHERTKLWFTRTLNLKNKKIDIAKHLFIMNNERLPKYLFNGLTNN